MSCLMLIQSVASDPVTGNLTIYGETEGCPSGKIEVTVTCGTATYQTSAAVTSAFDWTAVVPAANACGCGTPVTVVAACSSDPSCTTTFTSNDLCCCPQVSTQIVLGTCSGSTQLVTFNTTVFLNTACTFTFRRDFGDGTFGGSHTFTGPGTYTLPAEQRNYAPNTYTSTVDVLSPAGCGSLDSVSVTAQCAPCHTSSLKKAWCELLEFVFLVAASVALVLFITVPCAPLPAAMNALVTSAVALAAFLLVRCDQCVCDPVPKYMGQVFLIAGIIMFIFVVPGCGFPPGLALVLAAVLIGLGYTSLLTWYNGNRTTCPLIICDLWCTIGGLLNTRACTNLAIIGAFIVWNATGGTLNAGLGVALFVATIIGFIANTQLTMTPCNNATRVCR